MCLAHAIEVSAGAQTIAAGSIPFFVHMQRTVERQQSEQFFNHGGIGIRTRHIPDLALPQ